MSRLFRRKESKPAQFTQRAPKREERDILTDIFKTEERAKRDVRAFNQEELERKERPPLLRYRTRAFDLSISYSDHTDENAIIK